MCSRRCCFGRSSNRRIPCSKQKSASPELTQTNWNFQKDAGDVPHLSGEVRVVRFYVSCLLLSSSSSPLLLLLNRDPRRTVFSVGPQPRPSTPSVPCRTSTTTIHAQCSLPDLNRDHPRPVFPAGPQPRPCCSVPCRASTSDGMLGKMSEIECQIECQKECQIKCQR